VEPRRLLGTAKVSVVPDAVPPADPLLTEALGVIAEKQRSAQDLVRRLGGNELQPRLADRLVQRGILRREDSRVLGIFPRHRWPTVDATHEVEVRRSLSAALVGGQEPDPRTAGLVALLAALDLAHRTIEHEGLGNREIKRRAKAIADGDWAAAGVRAAVQAATAATSAAIAASTSAAVIAST
jgi:hypothetical protein